MIEGGRNSRVYQVDLTDKTKAVAKFYPGKEWDGRDRLETEYTSLAFVRDNGIPSVPRPIAIDRDNGCAIYEFIDGQRVEGSEITQYDIDQTTDFLVALKNISSFPGATELPLAGDSGLSAKAVYNSISNRLERLTTVDKDYPNYSVLQGFIDTECIPFLNRTMDWLQSRFEVLDTSFESEVDTQFQMLSPSDFGYHNVLRRDDGQLVFIDFEYFGWDDPAKLTSDFLLHPANDLAPEWKIRVLDRMTQGFSEDKNLKTRVGTLFPLIGLKWTLLLLNEFVPEHMARRRFSISSDSELTPNNRFIEFDLQTRQLGLAKEILRRSIFEFENFPYRN